MKGVLICLVLIMSTCMISAEHIVEAYDGEDSFLVNKDENFVFNISVNNADQGQDANITKVEITLPNELGFEANSNGTDASFTTFTDVIPTLAWTNSSGYLINGSEKKYFWFTAEALTSGNYTLIITTTNKTESFLTNLTVRISASTANCSTNINCTSWTACAEGTQTRNCTDLNSCVANFSTYRDCNCTANWQCTDWSDCLDGNQIRSCVDSNLCGGNLTKPNENQTCVMCTPNWQCTDWTPEKCSEDEIQSRECTDSNNCSTITGKPEDTRTCENESIFNLGFISFIFMVVILISMIAGDILLIIRQWKKINPVKPQRFFNSQPV